MRHSLTRNVVLAAAMVVVAMVAGSAVFLWDDPGDAAGEPAVSPFYPEIDPKLFEALSLGFTAPSTREIATAKISEAQAIRIAEERDRITALDALLLVVHDYGMPADAIEHLRDPGARPWSPPVPNNDDLARLGPGPGQHFQCLCWVVRWDPEPVWWTASNPQTDGTAFTLIWYPALVVTVIDAHTGKVNWSSATGQRKPTEEYKGGPLPPDWGRGAPIHPEGAR